MRLVGCVIGGLVTLALQDITTFHVGLDVVAEGWPKVFLYQQLVDFFDAKMAG